MADDIYVKLSGDIGEIKGWMKGTDKYRESLDKRFNGLHDKIDEVLKCQKETNGQVRENKVRIHFNSRHIKWIAIAILLIVGYVLTGKIPHF